MLKGSKITVYAVQGMATGILARNYDFQTVTICPTKEEAYIELIQRKAKAKIHTAWRVLELECIVDTAVICSILNVS